MITGFLRALYEQTLVLSRHRRAGWALAFVSFIESSFFPIPPDVMLIPMVLAARLKAWRYALICTLASVLGALLGYAIGYVFWENIGQPIVAFYNGEAPLTALCCFMMIGAFGLSWPPPSVFCRLKWRPLPAGSAAWRWRHFLSPALSAAPFGFSALPRLSIISGPIFKNSSTAISIFFP